MKKTKTHGSSDDLSPEKEKTIDAKDVGKIRHDEPVTVKGVARALLMADEPEQRMNVQDSDSENEGK